MQVDENLCKVETKDGDLYLLTRRLGKEEDEFDITITDGSLIWEAKGWLVCLITDDFTCQSRIGITICHWPNLY